MASHILVSDVDADLPFGDDMVRRMFARRLAGEIAGEQFVMDDKTRSSPLTRSKAINVLQRMFEEMHRLDQPNERKTGHALLDNQKRFAYTAGRPIDEALEDVAEEFHQHDLREIAPWVVD